MLSCKVLDWHLVTFWWGNRLYAVGYLFFRLVLSSQTCYIQNLCKKYFACQLPFYIIRKNSPETTKKEDNQLSSIFFVVETRKSTASWRYAGTAKRAESWMTFWSHQTQSQQLTFTNTSSLIEIYKEINKNRPLTGIQHFWYDSYNTNSSKSDMTNDLLICNWQFKSMNLLFIVVEKV